MFARKMGRKVYGKFISDGEKAQFYREDFIGEADIKHIPDWAREKLTAMSEITSNHKIIRPK